MLQGLLVNIRERLQGTKSFDIGDSALDTRKGVWKDLFAKMERLAALEEPWTLIIKSVPTLCPVLTLAMHIELEPHLLQRSEPIACVCLRRLDFDVTRSVCSVGRPRWP